MPTNQAYLLFLKRSKYQSDKERATRNLVRFEGLGANSHIAFAAKEACYASGYVTKDDRGSLRFLW
jgi:hypothetical protein